jgi:protein-L-isoaspartate(D-aspartate) O-methyltransferase
MWQTGQQAGRRREMANPEPLSGQMLDRLTASSELTPGWSEAFAAVARHRFIPDMIWVTDRNGLGPLHRREDPPEWMWRAYASAAVITQVDDGHPTGPGERGCYITSSASQPEVVALMLADLDVELGMRVLEIDAGTGYNAALLVHRLGAQNIISVEIDPALAEHVRRALTAIGYPVTVITGNGMLGYPPGAPYDRIISTAAVREVPYPWVAQTRSGGTILTPRGTPYHNGALASFTVHDDGTAQWRIVDSLAFMRLRAQQFRTTLEDEHSDESTARRSPITVTPLQRRQRVRHQPGHRHKSLELHHHLPPRRARLRSRRRALVRGPITDSWANLVHRAGAQNDPVHQSGLRNLWDEIDTAYAGGVRPGVSTRAGGESPSPRRTAGQPHPLPAPPGLTAHRTGCIVAVLGPSVGCSAPGQQDGPIRLRGSFPSSPVVIRGWPEAAPEDVGQALPGADGEPADVHHWLPGLGPAGYHLHRGGVQPCRYQQRPHPLRAGHRPVVGSDQPGGLIRSHQAKDYALTHQPLPSTQTGARPAHHTQHNSPDTIRQRGPWWFPSRATHVLGLVGVARPSFSGRRVTASGLVPGSAVAQRGAQRPTKIYFAAQPQGVLPRGPCPSNRSPRGHCWG